MTNEEIAEKKSGFSRRGFLRGLGAIVAVLAAGKKSFGQDSGTGLPVPGGPVSGTPRVSNIYIVSDRNRRPMLAKFSFTPESGKAFIATHIRLATTTEVRAIVEMSDGSLNAVSKN